MPETPESNTNIRVLIPGAGVHELPADTPSNDITDYARGVYNSTVGAMGDLAHSYWSTTTSPAKSAGDNFVNDLATAIYNGHVGQAHKAIDAFHEGRYSEAAGHALAAATPVVGPAAAGIGEKIGSGKVAEGLGEASGLIGTTALAGGEPEGGANPASAEDFVPSRVLTPEEQAVRDLVTKRLAEREPGYVPSKYQHLDADPDNPYDMSYEDRVKAVQKNAPLSDVDRTASAYMRRNRATLPGDSAVERLHGPEHEATISIGGKTERVPGTKSTQKSTVPSEAEVNEFIHKQYGDNAPTVKIIEERPVKATSAEINKAADKASTKLTHDYKYSSDTTDSGLTTHRVDVVNPEGKPAGYITAVETDPRTLTIDKAQVDSPGKGLGTNAYKELIDQAHKQGKDVRSGAVRSDAANKVWKNLKENAGVDVRVLPDNSLIARAPKAARIKAAPKVDLTKDWTRYAMKGLQ